MTFSRSADIIKKRRFPCPGKNDGKTEEAMKKKALIWIFIAAVLVLAAGLFLMRRAGKDGDGAAETPTQAAAPQMPEPAAIGGKILDA